MKLVLVISLVAVNAIKPKCNMTDVYADECAKNLIIFGNRGFIIPQDDAQLVQHCEKIDGGIQCLRRYSRTCLDVFSSQAMNIVVKNSNSMINRVCKDPNGRNGI